MSMWVMAASPLLTCNDVRNMTDDIKQILTNEEVLAVHKDALVKMAVRIDVGGGVVRSLPPPVLLCSPLASALRHSLRFCCFVYTLSP